MKSPLEALDDVQKKTLLESSFSKARVPRSILHDYAIASLKVGSTSGPDTVPTKEVADLVSGC